MATNDSAAQTAITRTDLISERIDFPIDRVWPVLSDFGGVARYMQGVEVQSVEGDGVGAIRNIPGPNGMIRERLDAFDAAQHRFSYRVLDPSPLAMAGYVGEVVLKPEPPQACRIEWQGGFTTASATDPETQKKGLETFYRTSIAGLKAVLAQG
jgi:hypothetical protein